MMRYLAATLAFLTFMGCSAGVAGTSGDSGMAVDDNAFPFSQSDFHVEIGAPDSVHVDLETYTAEDFERLAYYASIAWQFSGLEGEISQCLSSYVVSVQEDIRLDRNAEVWIYGFTKNPDKANFLISVDDEAYSAVNVRTFAHELSHVASECLYGDSDPSHKNEDLWMKHEKPANPMAMTMILESSYLDAHGRDYNLSDSDREHLDKAY